MSTEHRTSVATELATFIHDHVSAGDEPVGVHTDLVMSGLVDSLGVVRIVEWLERRLDIVIDPADVVIEHFESVAAIMAYLQASHRRDVD